MPSRITGTTSADHASLAGLLAAEAATSVEGLRHFFPANGTIIEGARQPRASFLHCNVLNQLD